MLCSNNSIISKATVDIEEGTNEEQHQLALPKRREQAEQKARSKTIPSPLDEILFSWNRRDALVHTGRRPAGHKVGHVVRKHALND